MNPGLKKIIRYVGVILLTGLLLWIAFGNIKLGFISNTWDKASKPYLILSALIALLSHYVRAQRWKLLLKPIGYPLKFSHSFMSVMVGYFVNLVIPRGGEFSRCYNLFKLNQTPVNISFGSVVSERIIDLFFLLVLIGSVFLVQLDIFIDFFASLHWNQNSIERDISLSGYLLLGFMLIIPFLFILYYRIRKYQSLKIIFKVKIFLVGIKAGVFSILKLEKRGLFILYSLFIWLCYYLMNYFVMQAFPATSELDLLAALTIFVIGGIALAIPLPGGAGSYHLLVSAGLTFIYGVANDHAVAFSVIVHAWQTLVIIVVGAGSLILSQLYYKTRQNEFS